jgi:hypothetical protein
MSTAVASPVETRRIFLVGSGRRIRNNFLPALANLDRPSEIVGIWSPTAEHAREAAAPWSVPVAPTFASGLADADTVMVSVATTAVPTVLSMLAADAGRLRLVLDTPVFGSARHLPSLKQLRRFAQVVVAEDYVHFPQWTLVRRAIRAGLAGPIRHVELRHSGFRYHGLALIRSLYGFPYARLWRRHNDADRVEMDFDFGGRRTGRIVEPYDQSRGATVITGERAVLVHRPNGADLEPSTVNLPVLAVEFDQTGPVPAFTLSDLRLELPQLAALLGAPTPDRTMFNALKTCGLMTVLSSLWSSQLAGRQGCEQGYDYHHALYDHLTTALLRQIPAVIDPLAAVRQNFVTALERAFTLAAAVSSRSAAATTTSPPTREEQ